jgi:hypothetical protein
MEPQAKRFNSGKNQLSLITPEFRTQLGLVLTMGAKKYDRDNWRKGLSVRSILDSLHRHLIEFENGNDLDEESHLMHLGHIAANTMFLMHFAGHPKWDDRIKTPRQGLPASLPVEVHSVSDNQVLDSQKSSSDKL